MFTAAVSATQTERPSGIDVLGEFMLGLVLAVLAVLAAAFGADWISDRVADVAGRNAITLVVPFAVYIAAEQVHASGVVAVVVAAVQTASMRGGDDVEDRLTGRSGTSSSCSSPASRSGSSASSSTRSSRRPGPTSGGWWATPPSCASS